MQIDVEHQTLNDIGAGECYLRGAKVDLEKRQATLQVCVRARGDQIMHPVIIFRNDNPHPKSVFKSFSRILKFESLQYQSCLLFVMFIIA